MTTRILRHDRVGDALLVEPFSFDNLARLRLACYESVLQAGLAEGRALMFVFAIDQGLVNAIQHGGGRGLLILRRNGADRLIAEVSDRGTGIPPPLAESPEPRVTYPRSDRTSPSTVPVR
jgi:anti-sigma regulatory factor (Ser/Thr protein kinase)